LIEIVIVTTATAKFEALEKQLESNPKVHIGWAKTCDAAIKIASAETPSLMIIDAQLDDKSSLDLAREVIVVNAGIHMALVSSLSADEFHNASEGLGILAQLPPNPGISEAALLLSLIETI